MQTESLIEWAKAGREFVQFVGVFLAVGAVGFHYAVHRRMAPEAGGSFQAHANRRAAIIGLVGVLLWVAQLAINLPNMAAQRNITVLQTLTQNGGRTGIGLALSLIAILGFVLAASGRRAGWALAALGAIAPRLMSLFMGQWGGVPNSLHMLAGGLWLGTLFVLLAAGIAIVFRHEPSREQRGVIVAEMVNRFSPLALAAGIALVIMGLITAWQHLNPLSSLWTTPYGYALIIKLLLASLVFAFGAWNWRRQRPKLGTEETAIGIRRSSTSELTAALIVLVASAILVSIPSPKPPGAPRPGATAPAQGGGPASGR